jgi:hypothetical protein
MGILIQSKSFTEKLITVFKDLGFSLYFFDNIGKIAVEIKEGIMNKVIIKSLDAVYHPICFSVANFDSIKISVLKKSMNMIPVVKKGNPFLIVERYISDLM